MKLNQNKVKFILDELDQWGQSMEDVNEIKNILSEYIVKGSYDSSFSNNENQFNQIMRGNGVASVLHRLLNAFE
jgi:hypothetical protein